MFRQSSWWFCSGTLPPLTDRIFYCHILLETRLEDRLKAVDHGDERTASSLSATVGFVNAEGGDAFDCQRSSERKKHILASKC